MISRRSYVKLVGGIGSTIGLAGCLGGLSGGNGGKPNKIRMGIWGGSWNEACRETIVKPFTEETGVEVESVVGQEAERLSQIIAEEDNPPVDVSLQDGGGLVDGSNNGVWMDFDTDYIPNLDLIPDTFKGEDYANRVFTASGLLYNTDRFDSAPDSWSVYLDEENEDKIALDGQDPSHDLMMLSLYDSGGETFKDIETAFELYESIVSDQDPQFIPTTDGYGNALADEEITLARYWAARAAFWNANDGTPVTATVPPEGAMTASFGPAIPKNIPEENIEWASKLVNQMLSTESGRSFAETMYYGSTNPEVEYPSEIQDQIINIDQLDRLNVPDFSWISENRSAWRERSNELASQ